MAGFSAMQRLQYQGLIGYGGKMIRDFACLKSGLAFGLLALVAIAPALLSPPMIHDAFGLDIVWTDQFIALLRDGTLYPRWLPASHNGLGSPVFYFYPPFAFYVAGLWGLLGLSAYYAVLAAFWTGLFLSGITMHQWLVQRSRAPLLWSALYMVMPYHMIDFYNRGALAEFWAYAIVPLIALGLTRAMDGRGWIFLAFAYATLVMTHLPMAVLTSAFFIIPLVVAKAIRRPVGVLTSGAAIISGAGLAAFYLVPMAMLQPHTSLYKMVALPEFVAQNWSVLNGALWDKPDGLKLAMTALAILLLLMSVLLATRRSKWGYYAVGMSVLVLGLVPVIWTIPILAKVQFPWRGLLLVEFALVTAFSREHASRVTILTCIAAMLMLWIAMFLARTHHASPEESLAMILKEHPDTLEYLPPGFTREIGIRSQKAEGYASLHRETTVKDGITVGTTFYFPAWRVMCSGQARDTWRDPSTSLVSWRGVGCTPFLSKTPAEKIGLVISLLTLIGMIFGSIPMLRRKLNPRQVA
jgi:hypothetical protein